jgi:hypothetical protein
VATSDRLAVETTNLIVSARRAAQLTTISIRVAEALGPVFLSVGAIRGIADHVVTATIAARVPAERAISARATATVQVADRHTATPVVETDLAAHGAKVIRVPVIAQVAVRLMETRAAATAHVARAVKDGAMLAATMAVTITDAATFDETDDRVETDAQVVMV